MADEERIDRLLDGIEGTATKEELLELLTQITDITDQERIWFKQIVERHK